MFAANADGKGVAAALALRIRADGSEVYEPIARFDAAQNRVVAIPLDLRPDTDQVFLLLFGTGIRFLSSLSAVSVMIGGVEAPISYAGPQDGFVGLDQINMSMPRALVGLGEVKIDLKVDGAIANQVTVSIR